MDSQFRTPPLFFARKRAGWSWKQAHWYLQTRESLAFIRKARFSWTGLPGAWLNCLTKGEFNGRIQEAESWSFLRCFGLLQILILTNLQRGKPPRLSSPADGTVDNF